MAKGRTLAAPAFRWRLPGGEGLGHPGLMTGLSVAKVPVRFSKLCHGEGRKAAGKLLENKVTAIFECAQK